MEFRFVFLIVLLISTITSAYFTFSFPFVRVNNEDIELSVLQEFTNLKSYNNTEQETEQIEIEEETEAERGNIGKENKAKPEVDILTTTLPSTTTTTSTTTTAVKVEKEQTKTENMNKLKTDTSTLTQTTPKTETDAERDAPIQPPTTTVDTKKEATDKEAQTNGGFFSNLDFGLIRKFEVLTELINYWMQEAETVENLINVVNQYKVIIANVVLITTFHEPYKSLSCA